MLKVCLIFLVISYSASLNEIYKEEPNELCAEQEIDPKTELTYEEKVEYCSKLPPKEKGQTCTLVAEKAKYEKNTVYHCHPMNATDIKEHVKSLIKGQITYAYIAYKNQDKIEKEEAGNRWNLCSDMYGYNSAISQDDCTNGISNIIGFDCCYIDVFGEKPSHESFSEKTCLLGSSNTIEELEKNIRKSYNDRKIEVNKVLINCEGNVKKRCNRITDSKTILTGSQCSKFELSSQDNECCMLKKTMPSPRDTGTYSCIEYNKNMTEQAIKSDLKTKLDEQTQFTKYSVECDNRQKPIEVGSSEVTCNLISNYLENPTKDECHNAKVSSNAYKCCKLQVEANTVDGNKTINSCMSIIPKFEDSAENQLKEGYKALGYEIKYLNIDCPKIEKEFTCKDLKGINVFKPENCYSTASEGNGTACCYIQMNKTNEYNISTTLNLCEEMHELGIQQTKEDLISNYTSQKMTISGVDVICKHFNSSFYLSRFNILFISLILLLI